MVTAMLTKHGRCWLAGVAFAGALVASPPRPPEVFHTHERCFACHNQLAGPAGQDISFGFEWSATMMANSARDPYWQAGVRRETLDHPSAASAIEAECSICHMPMARYEAVLAGGQGRVFAHTKFDPGLRADRLAADGVSCSLCHQIAPEKLGTRESFVGRFVIAGATGGLRTAFGPVAVDAGRARIMSSSSGFRPTEAKHIRHSELCASCHTLLTHSLDAAGKPVGQFPEQVPYLEWLHSAYREAMSCQACHMPLVRGPAPIASVLVNLRDEVSRHSFPGGNFFLQRLLNRFRGELAVSALPAQLERSAEGTIEHLGREAARLTIEDAGVRESRLQAVIRIENLAGHKLPTAYPSRRAWLHVKVSDAGGRILFESGALNPDGSIQGNDNDLDPRRYEQHYEEISSPEQVQIYEAIMGDPSGVPTTGLLTAVRYLKDNRLLPRGFDKSSAEKEVAVWGTAVGDRDFIGGSDRVRLAIKLPGEQGSVRIEVALWYQPVAYRWAANLSEYQAFEPQRFWRYFRLLAQGSAVKLAQAVLVR